MRRDVVLSALAYMAITANFTSMTVGIQHRNIRL